MIVGHTFGSVVADARKRHRMRVQALLAAIDSTGRLNLDIWNEVEQDRIDPVELGDEVIRALGAQLEIDYGTLKELVHKHHAARLEERKLWSMITEEAHAFRRQRSRD